MREQTRSLIKSLFLMCLLLCMCLPQVQAHVKWFTDGSYADRPQTVGEVLEGKFFYLLFCACLLVVILGVWLDSRISGNRLYRRMNAWLEARRSYAPIVMRIAAAMMLLLSWQGDAMLAPTLKVPANFLWVGWYQFALVFLLLFPRTAPLGGIGIIGIYIIGNIIRDPFHMLDYFLYVGCGFYIAVSNSKSQKWRGYGLMALYLSLGFSICWVALEKFIYPNWSLFLVTEHPQLAMGLNYDFFVRSVAFVEFGLGFLLIVAMLQRPLAVLISLAFFLTSTIFGKIEIIGHTMIHGALIVFLLEGPGFVYRRFHKKAGTLVKRIAFTGGSFVLIFFLLLVGYYGLAQNKYDRKQGFLSKKPDYHHGQIELAGYPKDDLPNVWMDITNDPTGGYNIHLNTMNFSFTPQNVGHEDVMGEGYAQLFINGQKIERLYSSWFHIPAMDPGTYTVVVTLESNNSNDFCIRGTPIQSKQVLVVKDKKSFNG